MINMVASSSAAGMGKQHRPVRLATLPFSAALSAWC
jgi:hypothetical protein